MKTSEASAVMEGFSPEARRVLDCWQSARDGQIVPAQASLDVSSIGDLLSNVWIYRFDTAQDDFLCHLAGEAINLAWGRNIKGATLAQIVGAERHAAGLKRWKAVIATPRLQHGRVFDTWDGNNVCVAERLILPMSGGGAPDRVLGYSAYRYRQTDRERIPPVWDGVTTLDCAEI